MQVLIAVACVAGIPSIVVGYCDSIPHSTDRISVHSVSSRFPRKYTLRMLISAITHDCIVCASSRGRKGSSSRKSGSASSRASKSSGGSSQSDAVKLTAAAKISAARSLARKLTEEKTAAAAAAELLSKELVDRETGRHLKLSVENEVANFAKQAGSADAAARMAKTSGTTASVDIEELDRLKRENAELQKLLLQLARDREEAEKELESKLKELDAVDTSESEFRARNPGKKLTRRKKTGRIQELLSDAILSAKEQGLAFVVVPDEPVQVGSDIRVLYNVDQGPLPGSSVAPALKIGFNRWETVEKFDMEKVEGEEGWYIVSLKLPPLLFRVDFVFEDKHSGAVDNNNGQDFSFELDNAPTAEEVTAARIKLLDDFEQKMTEIFTKEEDDIASKAMKSAEGMAKEARIAYVGQRKERILQEAREVVAERRQANVIDSTPGVFMWSKPPSPGSLVTLFYNKNSGPLVSASSVVAMVGYDSWWMQDTEAVVMVQANEDDLPKGAPEGDWYKASVDVWNTAAVLDFAFCDGNRQVWDNASGADYHTGVANATSSETLVQLLFDALETSDDSALGEEMAAVRVMQRASMRSTAARKRRELQRKFLFTAPTTPQAGKRAVVYYNPDRTVLRGRPEVFISGGYNRSLHEETIQPMRMTEAVPEAGGLDFSRRSWTFQPTLIH
jgi:hypothetical protein